MGWLLVLGLKEGLVECVTVCVKSWVILRFMPPLVLFQPIFGGFLFVFLLGLISMKFILDIFLLFVALSFINPSFFDDPGFLDYDNNEYT